MDNSMYAPGYFDRLNSLPSPLREELLEGDYAFDEEERQAGRDMALLFGYSNHSITRSEFCRLVFDCWCGRIRELPDMVFRASEMSGVSLAPRDFLIGLTDGYPTIWNRVYGVFMLEKDCV